MDVKVRGDGYAARSRKARDPGGPGKVVGGELRSKGVANGEEGKEILPTEFVFFHQIYQSQIRPFAMKKTACSPRESTVPAMPDYRRGPSAGGKMMGADKGKLGLPSLARLVCSQTGLTHCESPHTFFSIS